MDGTRWRRDISEVSLLPKVGVNLGTDQSRRESEGRGERGTRTRAVGAGRDNSLDTRRGYGDVTWREAGEDIGSRGEEYCGDNTNGIS